MLVTRGSTSLDIKLVQRYLDEEGVSSQVPSLSTVETGPTPQLMFRLCWLGPLFCQILPVPGGKDTRIPSVSPSLRLRGRGVMVLAVKNSAGDLVIPARADTGLEPSDFPHRRRTGVGTGSPGSGRSAR